MIPRLPIALAIAIAAASTATAAPVVYRIDPAHTFPSFEADHMGISVWRGKFKRSRGQVVLDRDAGSGTVTIEIDAASIDFGHDALNAWARGKDFLEAQKYPKARYTGRLEAFVDGKPTQAVGELRLHGVTRPVTLAIGHFKCIPHPLSKRELCGADASATIRRDEFRLDAGKDYGFRMEVDLRIQVEAVAER